MPSDTPRTNAEAWMIVDCDESVVSADFARQLERELAAAIEQRDGYLEGNRQTLRALSEANEIAARYKAERDEARRDACAFEAINRWHEAHPKGIMSPAAVFRIAREMAAERGWDCYAKEGGWGVSGQTDWIARMLGYLNAGEPWIVSVRDCAEYHNAVMALIKQRDEARHRLRDACADIARIETRFYDAVTPQQIAERNGWDCFEGGGA